MTGFNDFAFATRFREVIQRLIVSEIEKLRPDYQYATVDSIDKPNKTAQVKMPGEIISVTVRLGAVIPTTSGQIVKVEGRRGDRHITDVVGGPVEFLESI